MDITPTPFESNYSLANILNDDDELFEFLGEAGICAEEVGIDALTQGQQAVLVTYWAYGIHRNGGFQFYYEGANNVEQVAWAMSEVGLPSIADAFTESAKIIPTDVLDGPHEARASWIDQNDTSAYWEPLNKSVLEVSYETVTEKIRDYIKTHLDDFKFAP